MDAYHELAQSYDRLTNDVDYDATVDFYYEILHHEGLTPRTAVDLACGTGSVAVRLAQKGIQVTAADMSWEMLMVAQQTAAEAAVYPQFACQKLQQLHLPRAVDLAVCALDSIDYILDPADCKGHPAGLQVFESRRMLYLRCQYAGKTPGNGWTGVPGRGR